MKAKVLCKIICVILVLLFTCSNMILLGVYASNVDLEVQGTSVNHAKIEFDSYFNENQNKKHKITVDSQTKNIKLSVLLKVTEGNLKNGIIELSNSNFQLIDYKDTQATIQKIDIESNKIYLNQLNKGTDVILEIPIQLKKEDKIDVDYFTKQSNISLKGSYLDSAGEERQIEKEIKCVLEINGKAEIQIEQAINKYILDMQAKQVILQTTIKTSLENNVLPIKQEDITIQVPVINGNKPQKVVVVGKESQYNQQTGTVQVITKNEIQENQINWRKETEVYKVVYIYDENTYQSVGKEGVQIQQDVKVKIEAYNNEKTEVEKTSEGKITLTQQIGENINYQINSNTKEIYKGFLYHNSENEISFDTTWISDIAYSDIVEKIEIKQEADKYVTKEQSESEANTYFKTTKIKQENFNKILGEEGVISIQNKEGKEIGRIDKNTSVNEQGYFEYQYSLENLEKEVILQTTKPVNNQLGEQLIIEHTKSLITKNDYTKEEIQNFINLRTKVNNATMDITLKEPQSKIDFTISNSNLLNAKPNEVQFNIALRNNSSEFVLVKNPVIDIILPSYVENITIQDTHILFNNGNFKIVKQNILTGDAGQKIIRLELEGEQTEYDISSAIGGTNLFVNVIISTNRLMATKQDNIILSYTNQTEMGQVSIPVTFTSEEGLLLANGIFGYCENEQVESFSREEQIGKIEMNTEPKIATVKMTVVNNSKNGEGMQILGRLPMKNNKNILNAKELGSTFDTKLKSLLTLNHFEGTIYYSDNLEASKDLNDVQNGWSTSATENTKSYLIVIDKEVVLGDTFEFMYDIEIPGDLGANQASYTTYAVYFNATEVEASKTGIVTDTVIAEQVKNTMLGQSNGFIEEQELVDNQKIDFSFEALNNKVEVGENIVYLTTIKNISEEEITNLKIVNQIDSNLAYKEGKAYSIKTVENEEVRNLYETDIIYEEESDSILCDIEKLEAGESILLEIITKSNNETNSAINAQAAIVGKNVYLTKEVNITMKAPANIVANMSSSKANARVYEADTIIYTVSVENTGESATTIDIFDTLPDGLTLVNAKYSIDRVNQEYTITDNKEVSIYAITIQPGSSLLLQIETKVEELSENENERDLYNYATIQGKNDFSKIVEPEVQHYVSKNTSDGNYQISGMAWIDENKNGAKDRNEKILSDVIVKVIDQSTGNFVTDEKGNEKAVTTDANGNYQINGLKQGNYIIFFQYDSKLYRLTTYQKEGVIDALNSDAQIMQYKGEEATLTNSIVIKNRNVYHVNIGLIKNSIFDLRLDKYINNAIVQNPQGITSYTYDNQTQFAKVEIPSKYINTSTVIMEYRIIVTNEGDVPGYVKQILDYLPKDLKFSSELNPTWYMNTNSELCNDSLMNEIINPGETKEVTLLLTKTMTENNTGVVTNLAEIAKHYNELGIEEYDSVPGNKNQNEDDFSSAVIVIGIKTGEMIFYMTLTTICIVMLGVGIYLINKKVLKGLR